MLSIFFNHSLILKRCDKEIWRAPDGAKTINLQRHIDGAHPEVQNLTESKMEKKQKMQKMLTAHGGLYTSEDAQRVMLCWLAENATAFESTQHRLFSVMLSPEFRKALPSPKTLYRALPPTVDEIEGNIITKIKVCLFTNEIMV